MIVKPLIFVKFLTTKKISCFGVLSFKKKKMRACLTVCLLILQFQNFSERIAYMHFDVAHHTHKQTEGYPEVRVYFIYFG